ncbi:MAG TPA: allophanate hydrolase subunit 1 [Gemmataceae bacterium]|jgi:inhibitor of KinA|nr:allophanate hydrolase subunit 1 [Gemmataceae bacterium]
MGKGGTVDLVPLGDAALLAYCADEEEALHLAVAVRTGRPYWLLDVVQAYTSVAVYFDLSLIRLATVTEWLTNLKSDSSEAPVVAFKTHIIPCCYEMQLDLSRVAEKTGLSAEEVIRLHAETEYQIYAIGFCPGFPYLGYLPKELCGVPRLETPRLRVEPGSVGMTGRQTGIYPEAKPGGWNLIGRTPLTLVDVNDGYFPLQTGDRIRFERIDEVEFRKLTGNRL